MPRFVDNPEPDGEDCQAIRVGNKGLHAVEAIGHPRRCGPPGKMECIPGQHERDGIGQHVTCIREQRQRAREQAAERFGNHEATSQAGSKQHTALVGGCEWSPCAWPCEWP